MNICYKKRLALYHQNTPSAGAEVFLAFEDGTTSTTDLLVGADGIKSAVRRCLLNEQAERALESGQPRLADILLSAIEPKWLGIVAYRSLIPVETLKAYKETEKGKNVKVPREDSVPTVVCTTLVLTLMWPPLLMKRAPYFSIRARTPYVTLLLSAFVDLNSRSLAERRCVPRRQGYHDQRGRIPLPT